MAFQHNRRTHADSNEWADYVQFVTEECEAMESAELPSFFGSLFEADCAHICRKAFARISQVYSAEIIAWSLHHLSPEERRPLDYGEPGEEPTQWPPAEPGVIPPPDLAPRKARRSKALTSMCFRLLYAGTSARALTAEVRMANSLLTEPLDPDSVNDLLLWSVARFMERKNASR